MDWRQHPGVGLLVVLNAAVPIALLTQSAREGDVLSGLALAAGGLAYALMATNLLLALRVPMLEHLVGPMVRLYLAHRGIGIAIVGVIGVHVILVPFASLVDRGVSILEQPSPAILLGVLGLLVVFGSVALALNPKLPYHRWQPVHMAVAAGFVVLTAHFVAGSREWFSLVSPSGVLLFAFAVLGLGSITARLALRARGGHTYQVATLMPRERAIEVTLRPIGTPIAAHSPGQFAFLTAAPAGRKETHPFTLTSPAGSTELSVLVRSSGDWTALAQTGLKIGDEVQLSGPFGAFTPATSPLPGRSVSGWLPVRASPRSSRHYEASVTRRPPLAEPHRWIWCASPAGRTTCPAGKSCSVASASSRG